jgi:hypothetical protein
MNVRLVLNAVMIIVIWMNGSSLYGDESARDIDLRLRQLTPENASGFLLPLMESFSANLNRASFHTAEIGNGLEIYIGMKGIVAVIPREEKTYNAVSPYNGTVQRTATVVGTEGSTLRGDENGMERYPDGFNWNLVPVMIPQLHIGNFLGTQVFVRYLPSTKFDDKVGDLDILGGGITHSVSQYLPRLPVQLALQGSYQHMKLGDLFEATGTAYSFIASTRFTGLTLYGGLAYETNDFSVQYTYDPDHDTAGAGLGFLQGPGQIELKETFEDQFRATFGMSLRFIIFNLNADYSFGHYGVVSIGLGILI